MASAPNKSLKARIRNLFGRKKRARASYMSEVLDHCQVDEEQVSPDRRPSGNAPLSSASASTSCAVRQLDDPSHQSNSRDPTISYTPLSSLFFRPWPQPDFSPPESAASTPAPTSSLNPPTNTESVPENGTQALSNTAPPSNLDRPFTRKPNPISHKKSEYSHSRKPLSNSSQEGSYAKSPIFDFKSYYHNQITEKEIPQRKTSAASSRNPQDLELDTEAHVDTIIAKDSAKDVDLVNSICTQTCRLDESESLGENYVTLNLNSPAVEVVVVRKTGRGVGDKDISGRGSSGRRRNNDTKEERIYLEMPPRCGVCKVGSSMVVDINLDTPGDECGLDNCINVYIEESRMLGVGVRSGGTSEARSSDCKSGDVEKENGRQCGNEEIDGGRLVEDTGGFKNINAGTVGGETCGFKNINAGTIVEEANGFKNINAGTIVEEACGLKNINAGTIVEEACGLKNINAITLVEEANGFKNINAGTIVEEACGFKNINAITLVEEANGFKNIIAGTIVEVACGFKNINIDTALRSSGEVTLNNIDTALHMCSLKIKKAHAEINLCGCKNINVGAALRSSGEVTLNNIDTALQKCSLKIKKAHAEINLCRCKNINVGKSVRRSLNESNIKDEPVVRETFELKNNVAASYRERSCDEKNMFLESCWEVSAINVDKPAGRYCDANNINVDKPAGRYCDANNIIVDTQEGRSCGANNINVDTPAGRSGDENNINVDTPAGRSCDENNINVDMPVQRSCKEANFSVDVPKASSACNQSPSSYLPDESLASEATSFARTGNDHLTLVPSGTSLSEYVFSDNEGKNRHDVTFAESISAVTELSTSALVSGKCPEVTVSGGQVELPVSSDKTNTSTVVFTLAGGLDIKDATDECGLVDVFKLLPNRPGQTSGKDSGPESHAIRVERLMNHLKGMKQERQEARRQLRDVSSTTWALQKELCDLRASLTEVCDTSVVVVGEHLEAKSLEPTCYKRYTNIKTAADAQKTLTFVRNHIKALNDLEVLIYRQHLVFLQVFPSDNHTQVPPPKRLNRPSHKIPKSKRSEQPSGGLSQVGSVVIEIVSSVPEPNSWSKELSHTESPLTISTLLSISNEGTASSQLLTDTEV